MADNFQEFTREEMEKFGVVITPIDTRNKIILKDDTDWQTILGDYKENWPGRPVVDFFIVDQNNQPIEAEVNMRVYFTYADYKFFKGIKLLKYTGEDENPWVILSTDPEIYEEPTNIYIQGHFDVTFKTNDPPIAVG